MASYTFDLTGNSNDVDYIAGSNYARIVETQEQVSATLDQLDILEASNNSLTSQVNQLTSQLTELNNNYVTFMLNGEEITVRNPDPELSLINYLRDTLHLTGTKVSCNQGFCGVCTVLVSYKDTLGAYHNESMNSCLLKLVNCHGKAVTTIEGIRTSADVRNNVLHPIQEAFYQLSASQCGYCTPGFIMKIYASLKSATDLPTFQNLEDQLSGNICRCTGIRPIVEAYKAVLISIAENSQNGNTTTLKAHVTGNDAVYITEYDALKTKWAIGLTGGLLPYKLSDDLTTPARTSVQSFLNESSVKTASYSSNVRKYGTSTTPNGKFHVVNNLENLDTLISKLISDGNSINDMQFVCGLTSNGVPNFDSLLYKKNMIELESMSELNSVTTTGHYKFGSAIKQSRVASTLDSSSDTKYKNMASAIEYIASANVRNLGSWVGSLMMSIKSGFRGDWATLLRGSNSSFEYYVYNSSGVRGTLQSGKTYNELANEVNSANQLVLVVSVTIPQKTTNERFNYYRTASRIQNAQAFANAAISATVVDSSFSNLSIVVGAINGSYIDDNASNTFNTSNKSLVTQVVSTSGTYNVNNLTALFNAIDNLQVKQEIKFINKNRDEQSVKEMIKGYVVKFMKNESDLKNSKKSTYGHQTFNSGDVSNTIDDYPTWDLSGTHDVHILSRVANTENLPNRDQLIDYKNNGESFESIGRPRAQEKLFNKVQGKTLYSTEVPVDSYAIEMICSNIARGRTDCKSTANNTLIESWRAYPGVKAIILNDTWFENNMGTYDATYYNDSLVDYTSQAINMFNAAFYTYGSGSDNQTALNFDSITAGLSTDIVSYGQLIGGVVAENIELARYVAEQLTKDLVHIEENPYLELINTFDSSSGAPLFDPSGKLSDSNTISRIINAKFGEGGGRLCGPTKIISDNCFNTLIAEGLVDASDTKLQTKGFYSSVNDNLNRVYPNYQNETKGPYYATGNLIDTLGSGMNSDVWWDGSDNQYGPFGPYASPATPIGILNGFTAYGHGGLNPVTHQPISATNNYYMDNSYNDSTWMSDSSFGDYSGIFSTDSQAAYPLEPISFTVEYDIGNTLHITHGFQDIASLPFMRYNFKNLFPTYKSLFYDSSGQLEGTNTHDKFKYTSYASGGSFGTKFLVKNMNRLEITLLATMYLRKPIKYMDNWKFANLSWMGRYNSIEKSSMKIDRTTNTIDSLVRDNYQVTNKNNILVGVGTGQMLESSIKLRYIPNFASRATIIHQDLPMQFPTRGYAQVEGVALGEMYMSKGAALLNIPHYKLSLNQMTYVGNRSDPTTSSNQSTNPLNNSPMNSANLCDANNCEEFVMKELLIALLKNLQSTSDSSLDLSGVINDASGNVPKEKIIEAFDQYYNNNIKTFNDTNKLKKRGMSIVPHSYGVSQGYNNNMQCKISLDYASNKVILNLPIVDHGTGSFDKGVQVASDILKIDPNIITYVSENIRSSGLNHSGSTNNVGVNRAVTNASKKLLKEMLKRYPVNVNYYNDPSCVRMFDGLESVVIDGSTYYLSDNSGSYITIPGATYDVCGNTNSVTILGTTYDVSNNEAKLNEVKYFDVSNDQVTTITSTFDLSSNNTITVHGVSYEVIDGEVNLASKSGIEIVELYEAINRERSSVTSGNEIHNKKLPDLHKEIILRTLEFEYQKGFTGGQPSQGLNGLVTVLPYYQELLAPDRVITNDDMMNRFPMVLTYLATAYTNEDAGNYMKAVINVAGDGAVFKGKIGGGSTAAFGLGGQQLGITLGGRKLNPSTPNIRCGDPVYDGTNSKSNVFFSQFSDLLVTGNAIQDPRWTNDNATIYLGFEGHSVFTLALTIAEIDILTGEWVNKYTDVIVDANRSMNPRSDIGQLEGGWLFGSGYGTSENSSNLTTNGKPHLDGHWRNKLPTAKSLPEVFNAQLLNVSDSYDRGSTKLKGLGEAATCCGQSLPTALRDAVRQYRADVTVDLSGSSVESSNKFASDFDETDRNSCNYVFDMFQVSTEKIRKHTAQPNNVLAYLSGL